MAMMVMPYRGSEYGFPKELPDNLPSAGFEGWIINNGYPPSLITDIPGHEGVGWFCHVYDSDNTFSKFHPDNPDYIDPYSPVNTPAKEPTEAEANTTFTTNTDIV
jgi:hypothetical protein